MKEERRICIGPYAGYNITDKHAHCIIIGSYPQAPKENEFVILVGERTLRTVLSPNEFKVIGNVIQRMTDPKVQIGMNANQKMTGKLIHIDVVAGTDSE